MRLSMFAVLVALALGFSPTAEAQTLPSIHPSREACDNAVKTGNYSSYKAQNFVLVGRNPEPGSVLDSLKIEQPMCYDLLTFVGYRWVSLAPGEKMITCDGAICALASCWNPGREFFFPYLATPTPVVAGAEALARLSGQIHHSFDTLHVKVSGNVGLTLPPMPPQGKVDIRRSNGLRNFLLGLGTAAVAVGAYFLLRNNDDPPGVITLPPGVETRPPGPGVDTRPPGG